MFKSIIKKDKVAKLAPQSSNIMHLLLQSSSAQWMERDYTKFAQEAYCNNVIAHRCISMVASSAASVDWSLYSKKEHKPKIESHPLINLLHRPNNLVAGAELFESFYAYRMISGNSYMLCINGLDNEPKELHILRPDRVSVLLNDYNEIYGYRYNIGNKTKDYLLQSSNKASILHMRYFHPLDDWYGLSPIEAARYSIDQHNQAAIWNQSLLQNGARPSGALIVKNDALGGHLSNEQFNRLKEELESNYQGNGNVGKPLLLEGGLDWKEMGMSNKDMDFIEAKNGAARDIALAFGVPPQLLGIPGDNTYSNMQEARLALWEETILPLLDRTKDALNNWLTPMYNDDLIIDYDKESISALSPRREQVWAKVEAASFMTDNEKRRAVGLSPSGGKV